MITMNRSKSIFGNRLFLTVILLFLLEPAYLGQFLIIDKIYTWGSFGVTLMLILFVVVYRIFYLDLTWVILFYGVLFISTFLNGGELYSFMKSEFPGFAMCLVFVIWLHKNPRLLIKSLSIYEIFVYINLMTIILQPDGLYNNGMYSHCWFLGYKNPMIRTILPVICTSLISSYFECARINFKTTILLICSSITFLLNDSATSLVGMAVFLTALFIFHKKEKPLPKIINLLSGIVVTAVGFVMIIVMNMQYLFSYIINGVLGRDLTFTTRVNIWSKTLDMIADKFILGHGYLNGKQFSSIYGNMYATHPHNYYMYILMQGGVVLLAILLIGFIFANKKLNKTMNTVYSKIILFGIVSFLVMGLSESLVSTVLLYPLLILALNADKIENLGYGSEGIKILGRHVILRFR